MRVGYDQTSRGLDATLHRRRRSTLPSSVPGDRARTRARHSALIRNGSTTGEEQGSIRGRSRPVPARSQSEGPATRHGRVPTLIVLPEPEAISRAPSVPPGTCRSERRSQPIRSRPLPTAAESDLAGVLLAADDATTV